MASTYSTTLRIELIGNGDQSGTWGDTTNLNLGSLIEDAITGVQAITMFNADYTLTAYNGLPDEARNAVLVVGGSNSASRNIIAPAVEKTYIIKNSTTGGYPVVIKTSSGVGVSVPNGATQLVYCNGTDFFGVNGPFSGTTGTGDAVLATSPTLTGTPLAPTATSGTNTTQIATTAFVSTAITAATGALGTMSSQNASNVAITGGTMAAVAITTGSINALTTTSLGTNSYGTKTVSTSAPTGGSDGDIWYQIA